jgi:hypothetical protein
MEKQERYTAYDAQILSGKACALNRRIMLQPLRHSGGARHPAGYVDGWHGLVLSVLMAYYQWRLYVNLGRLGQVKR